MVVASPQKQTLLQSQDADSFDQPRPSGIPASSPPPNSPSPLQLPPVFTSTHTQTHWPPQTRPSDHNNITASIPSSLPLDQQQRQHHPPIQLPPTSLPPFTGSSILHKPPLPQQIFNTHQSVPTSRPPALSTNHRPLTSIDSITQVTKAVQTTNNRPSVSMDMHDENNTMLPAFNVNGEAETGVQSQRNDPHLLERTDHLQNSNGPTGDISRLTSTSSQQRLPTPGHVSSALATNHQPQPNQGQSPNPPRQVEKTAIQQDHASDIRRSSQPRSAPLSQSVSGTVEDTQRHTHALQGVTTTNQSGRRDEQVIPASKDQNAGLQGRSIAAQNIPGRTEGIPERTNHGPGVDAQLSEQHSNNNTVPGLNEVIMTSGVDVHSANKQMAPGSLSTVHLTQDGMKQKDGIMYHSGAQPSGVVMSDGNGDGRGMNLSNMNKKNSRMPGTKQCPSCRHTIAAAVAKCPKCPHIFREKKEKVKRSGKRGKKNCPKCKFENPSACSSCKQCKYIFRLKLMDKYKAMRPARQQNADGVVAAAAAQHAASSMHGQQQVNVTTAMTVGAGAVSGVPNMASAQSVQSLPGAVNAYSQFNQAMHGVASHGIPVMQPMNPITLPPHSHGIHPNSMAQIQQQIPQHHIQSHQPHQQM